VVSQTTVAFPEATANNSNASDLSGGAIGGVVGGVVGGLALLGLAGFFFWHRIKNSKRNPYAPANAYNMSTNLVGYPNEMGSNQIYTHSPVVEKYGHAISPASEVPADRAPAELPDHSTHNR
jgi:hypothetical protein